MSKLGSWRENIWGYAGRDLAVVPCWWSLYLCVEFFLWRRSCVSSPPAGGGVGSSWASFGVTAQRFPRAPAVFRSVSCSWLPFWGSTPSWLRLADLLLRWRFSVGWGCLGTDVLLPHLGFYLVPAQLPLRCSAPLTGASACLTPVCWSTPGVVLEGSLLRHLVFSHVPCSSSGPTAWAAFHAAGSLGVFRSPGVCPSASLVSWVGLQPFPSFLGFSCSACLLG